ncbi:MAG: SDR family oxidoreductase [Deltaproteobacteria bacterium]|nr:SDR family oxidoreductase [Deltaproteobacteria bacterium]
MIPESAILHATDLRIGLTAGFERSITENDVLEFARTSGDYNPLHIDPAYAAATNYGHRIVHGAFQVGMASAMLGMHLPGRKALLTLIDARFPAPLPFPSTVRVHAEIAAWNPAARSGRLRVTVLELASGTVTAEIGLGFSLHEDAQVPVETPRMSHGTTASVDRSPLIIITGASGGIGSEITRVLLRNYRVLAVYNQTPVPHDIAASPQLLSAAVNFSDPCWPDILAGALGEQDLYGIVHCAWPGVPRGGLLSTPAATIETQLFYGTVCLVELAKLLAARVSPDGGRMIALGSTYGSFKPLLTAASYSLAKSAMEHTVRLLAAELAARKITVNAICPSFVPAGMNRQADERRKKMEAAHTPLGRLCRPDDISAAAGWLLSPDASFVSGQVLGLTGAQL